MAVVEVQYPECGSPEVVRYGRQANGEQRYRRNNVACARRIFLSAVLPHRAVAGGQTANGRDGAQWQRYPRYRPRTRGEPNNGDLHAQKKGPALQPVNPALVTARDVSLSAVVIRKAQEVEWDEMWSFVGSKKHPRWLWEALDHQTGRGSPTFSVAVRIRHSSNSQRCSPRLAFAVFTPMAGVRIAGTWIHTAM